MGIQVVWLKRDLRLADHRPLASAAARGDVVMLYVYEPSIVSADDYDGCHLDFINESLAELVAAGGELGIERAGLRTIADEQNAIA